jgi:AraC-like DNA-binding protein
VTVLDAEQSRPHREHEAPFAVAAAKPDAPGISRALFLGTLAGLRALDIDIQAALEKLGLRISDLDHLPRRLTPDAVYELFEAVSRASAGFGVRMAERVRPEQFALFGEVIATSATVGEALMRGLRLFRLVSETVQFSAEFGDKQAKLVLEVLHSGKIHHEAVEFLLGSMVSLARRISGLEGRALEVRFTHDQPADARALEQFFRCPLQFGAGENAIVFDSAHLLTPVIAHDAERCAALQREAEALLADMTSPGDFRRDVVRTISREISNGDPSIERVAARLGMHPKALARRLRTENVTFRQLLEDVRFRLARRYLEEPAVSVTEIAFRLGYSEKSAFNRAFKRWTGAAPRDFAGAAQRPQK